jgi:hypothetical protein
MFYHINNKSKKTLAGIKKARQASLTQFNYTFFGADGGGGSGSAVVGGGLLVVLIVPVPMICWLFGY